MVCTSGTDDNVVQVRRHLLASGWWVTHREVTRQMSDVTKGWLPWFVGTTVCEALHTNVMYYLCSSLVCHGQHLPTALVDIVSSHRCGLCIDLITCRPLQLPSLNKARYLNESLTDSMRMAVSHEVGLLFSICLHVLTSHVDPPVVVSTCAVLPCNWTQASPWKQTSYHQVSIKWTSSFTYTYLRNRPLAIDWPSRAFIT